MDESRQFETDRQLSLNPSKQHHSARAQQGFSLIGFLCTLIVFGVAGLVALRAGPSLLEFWALEKAVKASVALASTPAELRLAFDKFAAAGAIDVVEGKDLVVEGRGKSLQASFSYEKKIPLYGPTSLLILYRGSSLAAPTEANQEAAK